jgi:hypothetical protein
VQLIVLGVFGEYVGRMYEQIKGRPLFIIDEIVRDQTSCRTGPAGPSRAVVLRVDNAQISSPARAGLAARSTQSHLDNGMVSTGNARSVEEGDR